MQLSQVQPAMPLLAFQLVYASLVIAAVAIAICIAVLRHSGEPWLKPGTELFPIRKGLRLVEALASWQSRRAAPERAEPRRVPALQPLAEAVYPAPSPASRGFGIREVAQSGEAAFPAHVDTETTAYLEDLFDRYTREEIAIDVYRDRLVQKKTELSLKLFESSTLELAMPFDAAERIREGLKLRMAAVEWCIAWVNDIIENEQPRSDWEGEYPRDMAWM